MTGAETNPSQSICVAALYGDLVLTTLIHDARGSLLTVCGWMELAIMKGETIPTGLERGIENLSNLITSVKNSPLAQTTENILASELINCIPGAKVSPKNLYVQANRELFRSVLSLAVPERIEMKADKIGNHVIVTITGLDAEGVSLTVCPNLSDLSALRADPFRERALAAALLRPMVMACGGSLLRTEATTVEIALIKGENK
jgi:hypothetical protein